MTSRPPTPAELEACDLYRAIKVGPMSFIPVVDTETIIADADRLLKLADSIRKERAALEPATAAQDKCRRE